MTEGAPGYTIADMPICLWDGDGILNRAPRSYPPGEPENLFEFMERLGFTACDLNGVVTDDPDNDLWIHAVSNPNTQPTDPLHMVFDVDGDRFVSKDEAGADDKDAFDLLCGP